VSPPPPSPFFLLFPFVFLGKLSHRFDFLYWRFGIPPSPSFPLPPPFFLRASGTSLFPFFPPPGTRARIPLFLSPPEPRVSSNSLGELPFFSHGKEHLALGFGLRFPFFPFLFSLLNSGCREAEDLHGVGGSPSLSFLFPPLWNRSNPSLQIAPPFLPPPPLSPQSNQHGSWIFFPLFFPPPFPPLSKSLTENQPPNPYTPSPPSPPTRQKAKNGYYISFPPPPFFFFFLSFFFFPFFGVWRFR